MNHQPRPITENRGVGPDLRALLRRMKATHRRYLRCILCKQAKKRGESAKLLENLDCVCWRCFRAAS